VVLPAPFLIRKGCDEMGLSLSGITDTISNLADVVMDFFNNTGNYCVEVLQSGLNCFTNFIDFSLGMLTADIDDTERFGAFWDVIDKVTAVLGVVATTLMILLFLINLCTDTWDNRHDLDMWDIAKMVCKMIVSVVLVANAMVIVKAIFNLGSRLAGVIFLNSAKDSITLSNTVAVLFSSGVSGIKGFVIFLLCLIVTFAIIASGVMIAMEIFQRVFKIYVLVPFSTITLSTFVMGNGNRGNEVFRSYLKTVINTAAEALIIVICVNFTYALLGNAEIMNGLLSLSDNGVEAVSVEITSLDDFDALMVAMNDTYADSYDDEKVKTMTEKLSSLDEYGAVVLTNPATYDGTTNTAGDITGLTNTDSSIGDNWFKSNVYQKFKSQTRGTIAVLLKTMGSVTVYVCPAISWNVVLSVLLSVLFPCILCCGAVKSAGQYASMIFGH
jgi:hypothetical protein